VCLTLTHPHFDSMLCETPGNGCAAKVFKTKAALIFRFSATLRRAAADGW
jgi:hypothetical protein